MNKKQRKQKLQRAQQHTNSTKIEARERKKVAEKNDRLYQKDVSHIMMDVPRSQPLEPAIEKSQKTMEKLNQQGLSPAISKFSWLHAFFLKLVSWWRAKTTS